MVSERVVPPVDEATCRIAPASGAQCLVSATSEGVTIPILLERGQIFWLNTYSPSDECWEKLMPKLGLGGLHRGVIAKSYSHSVMPDGLKSEKNEGLTVIQDEPLPINRVRLVAPPELDRPLPHVLPSDPRRPTLGVIQGKRNSIPFPDPGSQPPTITLEPGEVVELNYSD